MATKFYTPRGASLKERLKIRSKPGPGGCVDFTGCLNEKGYGVIKVDGRNHLAHRMSYEVHIGALARGEQALHRCDRPSCMEPTHLFKGDNSANVADRVTKGRSGGCIGVEHPQAKLTDDQVRRIRRSPLSIREAAKKFRVSKTLVGYVRQRKAWRHVTG